MCSANSCWKTITKVPHESFFSIESAKDHENILDIYIFYSPEITLGKELRERLCLDEVKSRNFWNFTLSFFQLRSANSCLKAITKVPHESFFSIGNTKDHENTLDICVFYFPEMTLGKKLRERLCLEKVRSRNVWNFI